MGHITYVRGVGSPVVVIICYSCKNFILFLFFSALPSFYMQNAA